MKKNRRRVWMKNLGRFREFIVPPVRRPHSHEREKARRRRQMKTGQLSWHNGLLRECRTGPSHHRLRYDKKAQS